MYLPSGRGANKTMSIWVRRGCVNRPLMSVGDSMDEGVDVCIVVYGQAVKLSDGH